MALHRASQPNRFSTSIWPGYVDALAALLLVLIFVLTVTLVLQSVMREVITDREGTIEGQSLTISRQQQRLDALGQQVSALSDTLGAAQEREADLSAELEQQGERIREAEAESRDRAAHIARLSNQLQASRAELADSQSRLTDFEAEVAALLAARRQDQQRAATLQAELISESQRASAAELAVAAARSETDLQEEQARLAAARAQALEALIADLREQQAETRAEADELQQALGQAEAARLVDAQAASALRARLESADAELTAMTLALEESRKQAEETLTLLAGAQAARDALAQDAEAALSEADRQAALLAIAQAELERQESLGADSQRRVALLNEQVSSLSARLGSLQALLDAAGDEQQQAELRVADLGQQLNAALLRVAEEREQRLALEEEARRRAEDEARDLARYRSEFFGRLSQILSGREGVQVVGDRFVFQSEVLFAPGEATLSAAGRDQVAGVVRMLADIAGQIPAEIDWIIRVDGHTDSTPLSGSGRYRDNWELSQARALAVVRYMIGALDFPTHRVAATGFSDTRPVAQGSSPEALAQNRRIELKLTER